MHIKVDSQHSAKFAKGVNEALRNGWSRAWEAEQRAEAMESVTGEKYYCSCDKRGNREAALLAVYRKDAETLYVSNIVPSELSELSFDQYNTILEDFNDTVLSNLKVKVPVAFLLGSNHVRVEDTMRPQVFELLRSFQRWRTSPRGARTLWGGESVSW